MPGERDRGWARKLAWFVGLWAASVAALAIVGLLIKWVL